MGDLLHEIEGARSEHDRDEGCDVDLGPGVQEDLKDDQHRKDPQDGGIDRANRTRAIVQPEVEQDSGDRRQQRRDERSHSD
ncbi:MAG: hypothetical protein F4Z33_01440 [Gemmatimonadales bacterium]|nr:hypothetical protein [Gemmatimonadales bacterium]